MPDRSDSGKEVDWASALMSAADEHSGVFTFDGRMVDGPVLSQARAILMRAG